MDASSEARTRFRFAEFVASPGRRQLLRNGVEVPLIPRYLDLLLLLLRRRDEAVSRREILEVVWNDVVVSDGALSQAVRTLRRTLGDDSRNPAFIRTVSRHGYRFTYPGVIEEPDREARPSAAPAVGARLEAPPLPIPVGAEPAVSNPLAGASSRGEALPRVVAAVDPLPVAARSGAPATASDPREVALSRLLAPDASEEDRREAAEALHALGTEDALRRLAGREGHEAALAVLRDARWSVPGAGEVKLLGRPGGTRAAIILMGMRARLAARVASGRWAAAAIGGAVAGTLGGGFGGIVLRSLATVHIPATIPVVFAFIGASIGFLGAAGVGAGFAVAEALARKYRGVALAVFGALGGGSIGIVTHVLCGWVLADLFGREIGAFGGGIDGLAIGGAAGLGYALLTPRPYGGGMATPRGINRFLAALATGVACALACVALTAAGRTLGAGSLDLLARSFQNSHAGLAAVGALTGEDGLGPASRLVLSAYEGFLFGCGLVLGITHRPRLRPEPSDRPSPPA